MANKKALASVIEQAFVGPMKFTNIQMEWTDTGARVLSSIPLPCPRCDVQVAANVEHLCGDRAPKPKRAHASLTKPKGKGKPNGD